MGQFTEPGGGEDRYCSDGDQNIDIDVALSYIDERLQDVLGHYQKDFEGGVSAKNLGAKFGGYGSFLPTYRRSPMRPHQRTPQEVQTQNIFKPINLPSKGAHRSSAGISSGFIHALAPPPVPVSRASSVDSSIKFQTLGECAPKRECMNLENSRSDKKSLKLQVRVGSDKIMSQRNAAIYSCLGLVTSPSTSLEDSPSECEGNFPETQETQGESPSSIIKVMTSFPVPNGALLSPLNDGFTCLMKEEGFMNINISNHVEESSSPLANKFASIRGNGEVLRYNEIHQRGKNVRITELVDESYEDLTSTHPKKADAETLMGDSLEALSASKRIDKLNGAKESHAKASVVNKSVVNDSSNFEKINAFESASDMEASRIDKWNVKTSLVERVQKDKKAGCIITNDGGPKGESGCNVFKEIFDIPEAKSDIPEGKKNLESRASGLARKKLDQKAKSPIQDGIIIPLGKKHQSSSCKMKSKGSKRRGTSALKLTMGSLRVSSSTEPEAMAAHQKNFPSKSKRDGIEAQKDAMKVKESQDQFVGKEKLEKEDTRMDFLGNPVKERPNASKIRVSIKETCAPCDKLKERLGGKMSSCPSTLEAHQEATKACALTGKGSISALLPTEVAPVVIQENWVGCDKCHKWRLLPYGENPDHLPKKWQCSMLHWLPGMNRCSVSEEETTNALNALYQAPVPEVQTVQAVHTQGIASVETLADAKYLGHNHQHDGFDVVSSGGMGRHNTKKIPNSVRHNSLINLPHFSRDQPAIPKRDEEPGDAKVLKMKYKREADQDGFRVSKKVKTTNMNYVDGDQSLDRSESELDTQKYNEYSSFRDSKGVTKKLKNQVNKIVTTEDQNKRYAAGKKKKLMDWQDSQLSFETAPSNGHPSEDKWIAEKQNSVTEQGKGKKPRRSELQRKESSGSIPDDRLNRKSKPCRIHSSSCRDDPADGNSSYDGKRTEEDLSLAQHRGNSVSRQAIDCKTSSKRDSSLGQLPMADNSSSSKISSSCKVKDNSQEVKGSPVESVSSSPLRTRHKENFKIKPLEKDAAAAGADFSLMNNPRRCLKAETDNKNNRLGRAKKEKPFPSNDQRSMKSLSFDHQDWAIDHKIRGKVKACTAHPSKLPNTHFTNTYIGNHGQDNQYPNKLWNKKHCHEKERVNNLHFHKGSVPQKLGNVSSSRAKQNHLTSESGRGSGSIGVCNSHEEQKELFLTKSVKYEMENEINNKAPRKKEMNNLKFKIEHCCSIKSDRAEKSCAGKKFSALKWTSESCKIGKQTKFEGHDHLHGKPNTICQKDGGSIVQQNHKVEKSLKCLSADITDQVEIASGKRYSPRDSLSQYALQSCLGGYQPISDSKTGNGSDIITLNGSDGSAAVKATRQHGESEGISGINVESRGPTPNSHGVKDIGATDPVKPGSSIRAARNALKEAKNLKHLADHLKISGSGFESTELFFQAALKFLHGAALLELCNSEGVSCGEMSSVEVFSRTAKLCEYCANEFEKWKSMAFAALSYKCMEVAYMQVIYSTDSIASRDRSECQMALELAPPVESPSSSVSGVYNLNNQVAVDKMDVAKDAGSQVVGNHVIAARNRPNFVRLLDFAQIVGFAMDASWKSQNVVAAANLLLAEDGNKEGISYLKRVLDFSFHDIDGFLHLVRLAMELFPLSSGSPSAPMQSTARQ